MWRDLSVVGLSSLLYVALLVAGTLIICNTGHAQELTGEWATQGNVAHVRVEPCVNEQNRLCGIITWLWEPIDADGGAVRDAKNPDPNLRQRSVIGLSLLTDFRYGSSRESMDGQIYNPENGRTYKASLRLRSPDMLEVKGCLLFVCDTQIWRRVESLCTAAERNSLANVRVQTIPLLDS